MMNTSTKAPGLELPLEEIHALCRRFRVRELALFGSALRDDFRADSDVGFLVDFEPDAVIGFLELASLQNALSALIHHPVDMVPKSGLKPLIRDEVISSARVIHAA